MQQLPSSIPPDNDKELDFHFHWSKDMIPNKTAWQDMKQSEQSLTTVQVMMEIPWPGNKPLTIIETLLRQHNIWINPHGDSNKILSPFLLILNKIM